MLLNQLVALIWATLFSHVLAAPDKAPGGMPEEYWNDIPDGMCHIDIHREEKAYDHNSATPFRVAARVYDSGDNKVGELALTRCPATTKTGAQRCELFSGLKDQIWLSPVFRKGAYRIPERDYVHVDMGNHTSFTTDNAVGSKGLLHHCRHVRTNRDQHLTSIMWSCNFQCYRDVDRPKAGEDDGWVAAHGWRQHYDGHLALKDDDEWEHSYG